MFVTNAGNDHLAFTEGGYQVAFMGDGDDQLYVNTNTYGTNNYYFADMGNEVYEFGQPSRGDQVIIDHFWDGTSTVGQIEPLSNVADGSIFVVKDNYGVEELRISTDMYNFIVEKPIAPNLVMGLLHHPLLMIRLTIAIQTLVGILMTRMRVVTHMFQWRSSILWTIS